MKKTIIAAFASLVIATPALADGWNAIALDPHNGDVGYALGKASKEAALTEAKKECEKSGATCGESHAQEGGCIAVSRNHDGSRFGVAMEATIEKTVVEALKSCSHDGKYAGCTVHTNRCAPASS